MRMVALKQRAGSEALEAEPNVCCECGGTGTVSQWNEVAYFDDRRICTKCDAGRAIESKIGDIVRRAQLEERLAKR
jgi:DnaJ-class molecular chaperone